ncbi:hypothetical protein Q5752_001187 [Cryptotrichosporon argae]
MSVLGHLLQRGPGAFPKTPDHPAALTSVPIALHPSARVHAAAAVPPVDAKLYSGFLEHLGRCIYGGLVDDPKAPSPAALLAPQDTGDALTKGRIAWRTDVQKILAKDGELEVPMMRWPGGNFVSNYHWQDGVGPIADRPKRVELAWLSSESNHFGTNEFIDMCRANDWEPYICLNMGTGTLEEALAWLEYCNGTGDTHWANLRRKHTGRDEPHAVKYWGLGNEIYGPWQVGNLSAKEYVANARRYAHALRLVDPSIKLISCGQTGADAWDKEVLDGLIQFADLHSIHYYTMLGHPEQSSVPGFEYEKNVFGPAAAELHINVCRSLIDLANIQRIADGIPGRDMKICFDEWNVWDEAKAPGSVGLEQTYDYTDMLGVCAWLNVLVRKHKDVEIACIAQSVNVISPLMTRPDGILKQTTYYPLELFAKYMKNGHLLALPAQPDVYAGPSYPVWIQQTATRPAYVDTVALITDAEDSVRLSVLNRHPSADYKLELALAGFAVDRVRVWELYADDLAAVNTFEKPDTVVPTLTEYTAAEWAERAKTHTVKKHSWQFLMFDGQRQ